MAERRVRRTLARSLTLPTSKSPRTLLFLQLLPRPASGSPFHYWQPGIFGCWPTGVEQPATGGYVSAISDTFRTRLVTFLFTVSYPDIRLI